MAIYTGRDHFIRHRIYDESQEPYQLRVAIYVAVSNIAVANWIRGGHDNCGILELIDHQGRSLAALHDDDEITSALAALDAWSGQAYDAQQLNNGKGPGNET